MAIYGDILGLRWDDLRLATTRPWFSMYLKASCEVAPVHPPCRRSGARWVCRTWAPANAARGRRGPWRFWGTDGVFGGECWDLFGNSWMCFLWFQRMNIWLFSSLESWDFTHELCDMIHKYLVIHLGGFLTPCKMLTGFNGICGIDSQGSGQNK
jgi:hypothetical protein